MQRRLRAILCGVTLIVLASLYFSYSRLIRSVESAATAAGIVESDAVLR